MTPRKAAERKSVKKQATSKQADSRRAATIKKRMEARQTAFLAAFAQTGNITEAAAAVQMDREDHYRWMRGDETYPPRYEVAEQIAADYLEQEARRRAVEGLREYKFHQGQPIIDPRTRKPLLDDTGKPVINPETKQVIYEGEPYFEHKYSDTLLIFLMKGAMPDKYRERREVTGADGGPVKLEHGMTQELSVEEASRQYLEYIQGDDAE